MVSLASKDTSLTSLLSANAGGSVNRSKLSAVSGFESQLAGAIRSALESAGLNPELVHVSGAAEASQNSDSAATSRQFLVTIDTTLAGQSSAAATTPTVNATAEPAAAAASPKDAKSLLGEAMQRAGLDPTQYAMSLWSETVYYPGGQFLQAGSYVNNFITVDLGAKGKANFSSDLMVRNPEVTVSEIQQLLKA